MARSGIARVITDGGSQAVRLPKDFRLPGDRVRVSRTATGGLLLEPRFKDRKSWLAELARFRHVPFMENGREQPAMPEDEKLFE